MWIFWTLLINLWGKARPAPGTSHVSKKPPTSLARASASFVPVCMRVLSRSSPGLYLRY